MDYRTVENRVINYTLDIAEGVAGFGIATGAYIGSLCAYELVSYPFQDEHIDSLGNTLTTGIGSAFYASIMYSCLVAANVGRAAYTNVRGQ